MYKMDVKLRESDRLPYIVKKTKYPDTILNTSEKVSELCINKFKMHLLPEENVYLFTVTANHSVIGFFELSKGTISYSTMTFREIFLRAVLTNAYGFFVVHNHPSGDCFPSKQDLETASILKELGKKVYLPMVDFVIIGNKTYFSYSEYEKEVGK